MPPKTRRSLRDALPEEQEEEIALARRMSPLALDEPAGGLSRETARASARDGKNLSADLVEVTVDPYDFDAFAEEVERVTARVPGTLALAGVVGGSRDAADVGPGGDGRGRRPIADAEPLFGPGDRLEPGAGRASSRGGDARLWFRSGG